MTQHLLFLFLLLLGTTITFAFQPYQLSPRPSFELNAKKNDHVNIQQQSKNPSRRSLLKSAATAAAVIATTTTTTLTLPTEEANAAPPISIIAEELGYFPVTNRSGETVYIPGRVRRKSSEQSIKLAQHLKAVGAVMYGAYWCPHCVHQKELFGSEAWSLITYTECSTKGFNYDANKLTSVVRDNIEGYPTWNFPKNKKGEVWVSGEMPLERFVALSGFKGDYDGLLEGPEVAGSSGACR